MNLQKHEKCILNAYNEIPLPKYVIDSEIYFYYGGYVDKLLSNIPYKLNDQKLFEKEYIQEFNKKVDELDYISKTEILEFYYLLKLVFNILKKYSA